MSGLRVACLATGMKRVILPHSWTEIVGLNCRFSRARNRNAGDRSEICSAPAGRSHRRVCASSARTVMAVSRLLEFYSGHSPNSRGRYLRQLQSQSFDDLEHVHDYIQWMFPLLERSAYNVNAPVLSTSDVVEFRRDERLRCALLESFAVMLKFYGIDKTESDGIVRVTSASTFPVRSTLWLQPGNHNFLRITRILRSLCLLGCRSYATALLEWLQTLYAKHAPIIGEDTFRYWTRAVLSDEPSE